MGVEQTPRQDSSAACVEKETRELSGSMFLGAAHTSKRGTHTLWLHHSVQITLRSRTRWERTRLLDPLLTVSHSPQCAQRRSSTPQPLPSPGLNLEVTARCVTNRIEKVDPPDWKSGRTWSEKWTWKSMIHVGANTIMKMYPTASTCVIEALRH